MVRCWLALTQKKVPASLTRLLFCEVLNLFAMWFSADIRMQKANYDKFDQWRRRMWSNMVTLQYLPAASCTAAIPWRRAPDQRQRPAGRYLYILGRASSEPHSYVLTWLSVTIYIYIYKNIYIYICIYRPADRCLWSGARRQGRMLWAKAAKCSRRENDLLYWYMFLHIRLRTRHWSTWSEFSFCVRLSALNHSAKNIRTSEKCHQVKEARTFFCLRASRHRNMFFCFPICLPIEKAYSTKERYYCNSLSCKLLPQLIDNSATKGSFLTDNWVTLVFHTLARC